MNTPEIVTINMLDLAYQNKDKKLFAKYLSILLRGCLVKDMEMAQYLRISEQSLYRWQRGALSLPRRTVYPKLREALLHPELIKTHPIVEKPQQYITSMGQLIAQTADHCHAIWLVLNSEIKNELFALTVALADGSIKSAVPLHIVHSTHLCSIVSLQTFLTPYMFVPPHSGQAGIYSYAIDQAYDLPIFLTGVCTLILQKTDDTASVYIGIPVKSKVESLVWCEINKTIAATLEHLVCKTVELATNHAVKQTKGVVTTISITGPYQYYQ